MGTKAVWARAISCSKINASPIAYACDLTIGSRMSLWFTAAVIPFIPPLANAYRSVRPSKDIAAQICAPIVPHKFDNATVCTTFSLASPHPSTSIIRWLVKLLSSMKSTGLQWRSFQVWCSRATLNRTARCCVVRNGPRAGRHTILMEFIHNSLYIELQ